METNVDSLGPEYYDIDYFDPTPGGSRKSNYEGYRLYPRFHIPLALILTFELLSNNLLHNRNNIVIAVGCAKGYLVKILNALPHITAYGFDFSRYAVQERADKTHVFLADTRSIPFATDSAHCMLAIDLLEHIQEDQLSSTIEGFYRVLRPGGTLFVLVDTGLHNEDDQDMSHVTIRPYDWWKQLFLQFGFTQRSYSSPIERLVSFGTKINHIENIRIHRRKFESSGGYIHRNIFDYIWENAFRAIGPCFDYSRTLNRDGIFILEKPPI